MDRPYRWLDYGWLGYRARLSRAVDVLTWSRFGRAGNEKAGNQRNFVESKELLMKSKELVSNVSLPDTFAPDKSVLDKSVLDKAAAMKRVLAWQDHRRGEDLRLWQIERHAEELMPLITVTEELARRILAANPKWEVQQQVHLSYASLEVSACLEAEKTVVECRWAEEHQWQGLVAVQVSLPVYARCLVTGRPEQFVFNPDGPPDLIDAVLLEVESEVNFHAVLNGNTDKYRH